MTRICRFHWPRGLSRGSAVARLLGLWVRIPPDAWMSVCCECCVLSLRRADHSYRGILLILRVSWVWSWCLDNEEALAHLGLLLHGRNKNEKNYNYLFNLFITGIYSKRICFESLLNKYILHYIHAATAPSWHKEINQWVFLSMWL